MSHHGHDSHDIQKDVQKYKKVFYALIVGTVVTVGAYYIHFDSMAKTVALALFIASIKAFLVAGYFMHLMSERKMIYAILVATIFFFGGLMYLTLWSMEPKSFPTGTVHRTGHAATKH